MTPREHLRKIWENVRRQEKEHREAADLYKRRAEALDLLVEMCPDDACERALNALTRDAPSALVN